MLADIGWGLTVFKNPTLDSFQQGFRALYLCIELNELLSFNRAVQFNKSTSFLAQKIRHIPHVIFQS